MESLEDLLEQELIRQIADPILEKLFEIEGQMGQQLTGKAIRIELIQPDESGRIWSDFYGSSKDYSEDELDIIETILHSDSFLKKLEIYLQQQVEIWHNPILLH